MKTTKKSKIISEVDVKHQVREPIKRYEQPPKAMFFIMMICMITLTFLIGVQLGQQNMRAPALEDTSIQTTCNYVCLTNTHTPARGVIIDMSLNKGQCVCTNNAVVPFDVMG